MSDIGWWVASYETSSPIGPVVFGPYEDRDRALDGGLDGHKNYAFRSSGVNHALIKATDWARLIDISLGITGSHVARLYRCHWCDVINCEDICVAPATDDDSLWLCDYCVDDYLADKADKEYKDYWGPKQSTLQLMAEAEQYYVPGYIWEWYLWTHTDPKQYLLSVWKAHPGTEEANKDEPPVMTGLPPQTYDFLNITRLNTEE